jgi:Tfp pilus assembly protein PilF
MRNQDIKIMSLDGLVEYFNEQCNTTDLTRAHRPFCFILGAGASISSGIPTGAGLAKEWLNRLHIEAYGQKPKLEEWATEENLGIKGFKYSDLGSFYSQLYEKRFADDPVGGFAFLEQAMAGKRPSVGYAILAYFLAKTQHKVVITTNFDNLVADAVSIYTDTFPLVLGDPSLAQYASVDVMRPMIAKIHGALGFAMRNSSDETGRLASEWEEPLKEIFAKYTPIVIGYDGNDGGLMGLLQAMPEGSIKTIFWCKRWDQPTARGLCDATKPKICDLLHKHKGCIVPILGFDEMMVVLQNKFKASDWDVRGSLTQKLTKFVADYDNQMGEIYNKIKKEKTSTESEMQSSDLEKSLIAIAQKQKVLPWWEWQRRVDQAPDTATKEKIFEEALKQSPRDQYLLNNYGVLLDRKGDTEEAENYYKKAFEADPKYATALNNYAFLLEGKGNTEEAEIYYKKAIEADPKYALALGNYAILLGRKGNNEEAESYYKKAIEADPKSARTLTNYAVLLEKKGNTEEAEIYYKKAFEADPKYAPALNNYAILLEGKGNNEEAETYYKKAIQADPKYARALNNYAILLEGKGNNEEAEIYYKKAIEADPKYARALNNYAILLEGKGNNEEAEIYYKKAIEADPKDATALHSYAILLEGKGNTEEAEIYYKKAIEADPKDATALSNYGVLLERKGNNEEAESYYKKAIEADPKDANAKANLAHMYFLQKKMDTALELLRNAESLAPQEKPLKVEMLFYRLAYDPEAWPVRLQDMQDLLAGGARSPNWPLDNHAENAKSLEHPNVELLLAIANVASKGAPLSSLESFDQWPKPAE